MSNKPTFLAAVKDVRFTFGGFGEQYWTLTTEDGTDRCLAMWMDFRSPLWAKVGEKVRVREDGEFKVGIGNSTLTIKNTGAIVEKIPA